MFLNHFKSHLQESMGIVYEQLKFVAFDICCFEALPGGTLLVTQDFHLPVNDSLIEPRWRFPEISVLSVAHPEYSNTLSSAKGVHIKNGGELG